MNDPTPPDVGGFITQLVAALIALPLAPAVLAAEMALKVLGLVLDLLAAGTTRPRSA